MTAQEYAQRVDAVVRGLFPEMKDHERTMHEMAVTRAVRGAQDYEVSPGVQGVEVKPLYELVHDVREEAADVINYAVALMERVPELSLVATAMVHGSMVISALCDQADSRINIASS